jgi:hypothetical protein
MLITHFTRAAAVAAATLSLSTCTTDTPLSTTRSYQKPSFQTRSYQMSILASTDGTTAAGVDIPIFTQGVFRDDPQPAGRSIVWLPVDANLDRHSIADWTRIVAVYVDEPYGNILNHRSNCDPPADAKTPDAFAEKFAALAAMATAVRAKAPSARFWVNLTRHDVDLIRNPAAGCAINQPYIDVISMDIYDVDFRPTLSERYEYLHTHRATPHQQLALVAGTFTGGYKKQDGAAAVSRLSGYFNYAAQMNQHCDLPLGPAGKTGIYDGCPVWMVAGWMGGTAPVVESPRNYLPIDHPSSRLVLDAWQAAFAVPRVR